MNSVPAIEVRKLSFAYDKAQVLSHVNLTVEAGDFLAIVGPNGGGKTTLLKLLVGLLKPQEGEIRLFGEKVPSRRISAGYVPQNTNCNLEFPITVEETVATGLPHYKSDPEKIREVLDAVKIGAFASRRLGELSGGERQRVLIARALASDPQILFLDEPSSHIDARGQDYLYELLATLNERMTIVIVSHDRAIFSKHVKNVAVVNGSVRCLDKEKISLGVLQDWTGTGGRWG